jgi:3-oxoacyl-[acyl-carrier-protein] synthase III
MIPARIAGTAWVRPGRAVTTAELVTRLHPRREAADVEARTGIVSRYLSDNGATAAELGAQALRAALAAADMAPRSLARIIFVDSLGGDMLIPTTSNGVAAALGVAGTCDCFDLNNACMGFLSALDLAARSVATGHGPVGIAVVELGSRYITPNEPRPFLVLGDGVAGVVVDEPRGEEGILASFLCNDGTIDSGVRLRHAALTRAPETIRFGASSEGMSRIAVDAVRRSTKAVLSAAGLALADIEWVLPHQPNGTLLTEIIGSLDIDPARVVRVVHEVGSVGAASIPISLDRLLCSGSVRPDDRLLMVGVGAGLSSGAILYRTGR